MLANIKTLAQIDLIGQGINTNFLENKTAELWKNFRPLIPTIPNRISEDLFSLEIYEKDYDFNSFQPGRTFQKWAAVQVAHQQEVSPPLQALTLPGGLYAEFNYVGLAADAAPFYQKVFSSWMPANGYLPDHRPYFAVMGKKYKHNDPSSEELIYFPIKRE